LARIAPNDLSIAVIRIAAVPDGLIACWAP
jgi:hypothetical protein